VKKPVRPGLVPPAEGQRYKRFRLSIVGADEDMPRLVRAYGRACQGEFGLVLRPPEQRGVLVLVTKKDGAYVWRSGEAALSVAGQERATAEVVRGDKVQLRIVDGEYAGVSFGAYEEVVNSYEHGDEVQVVFEPDDQFAHLAEQLPGGHPGIDAPEAPQVDVSAAEAVKAVQAEQKAPPKVGPVTLRGRWTGYLYCEGGAPRVELKRRLATYGTLWVFSTPGKGWAWTFERDSKWFGGSGDTYGQGLPTLQGAVHIAVLGAMTLVKDACSFRDTHRRAAHDDDYATKHPIRKREPKRNPTDRLKEPKPKKPRTRTRKAKPKVTKAAVPVEPSTARRRPAAPPPSPAAAPPPPKKRRTRKTPAPKKPPAATGPVDADKDKALIDAFSKAFAEVLGEGTA